VETVPVDTFGPRFLGGNKYPNKWEMLGHAQRNGRGKDLIGRFGMKGTLG